MNVVIPSPRLNQTNEFESEGAQTYMKYVRKAESRKICLDHLKMGLGVTRFAPSPTGYLHIGGARTALFNYLFAKHFGGKFLLRIEDTDKARSNEFATKAILDGLQWLNLQWDGEIVFQSLRTELYKQAALDLIASGNAYYCFTPQEEIIKQRDIAISNGEHFIFKSPWRDAAESEYPKDIKPVVRLRAPRTGVTVLHDILQGDVVVENLHLDDMVLLRSDGSATYMLAVVVDDHAMGITHIIRGDDHLTNAIRQILLYNAFEWSIPCMVHIPLIHGPDGSKLSKRHGALGIKEYEQMGYLPEALCNYLLRLGWSHGNDEIISFKQSIEWFNLDGLGLSPARLDFDRMKNLNAHYLRLIDNKLLAQIVIERLSTSIDITTQEAQFILQGMDGMKIRASLIVELVNYAKIYAVNTPLHFSETVIQILSESDNAPVFKMLETLPSIEPFNQDNIQDVIKKLATELNMKLGSFMIPIRILMTGSTASPSIFEIMSIIGKENTINRLSAIHKVY